MPRRRGYPSRRNRGVSRRRHNRKRGTGRKTARRIPIGFRI